MGCSNLSSAFINKITDCIGEVVNPQENPPAVIQYKAEKTLPLCTQWANHPTQSSKGFQFK